MIAHDIEDIKRQVAVHYNLTVAELESPKRSRHIVRARQMAMYLARALTGLSLAEIGRAFGRNHNTVAYSCQVIEDRTDHDEALYAEVGTISSSIPLPDFGVDFGSEHEA